ncbi:MAG: right-handed parallel beta-helix repeat-containing protein, partial [bacterium]
MKTLHSLCMFMLALASISYADFIEVSGDVSGIWDADTVLVTGEVQIPAGQSLTISPGVEVLFMGNYKLIANDAALLQAIGTETDSIRFDWYYEGMYWHGIRFIVSADSSRLEYCIIKHGFASGADVNGGGIQINTCSPTITHCTIDSCKAAYDGGAIWAEYSASEISFCTITNNFGDDDCGAISFSNSNPVFNGNYIAANWADDSVGGAFFNSGTVTFTDNTVTGNWAGNDGGGLFLEITDGLIANNTISNNSANEEGGGVFVNGPSNLMIEYNLINDNFAADDGGGILFSDDWSCTIRRNIIADNTTNQVGGGICVQSGSHTIIDNEIYGNQAGQHGGGIYNAAQYIIIQGNLIASNSCESSYNGGGIYLNDGDNQVINNVVCNNSAYKGGGIYCESPINAITGNQIYLNEAYLQGGGLYCENNSNDITYNYITNNQTTATNGQGGGVFLIGSNHRVASNVVNENFTNYGGGIYISACNGLDFYNNDLAHNIAVANGGGMYLMSISIDLRDNNLRGNSASQGGAIYANASTVNLTNHIIWENSPSHFYGQNITVTYSDVSGGYTGQGNFDRDPMFIAPLQPDGHLLWGSPCIDNGNPSYTDPDSTISDVGTHFYDQLTPVRIVAIPYDAPIQVPSEGGEISF